jgi:hypothetical protein
VLRGYEPVATVDRSVDFPAEMSGMPHPRLLTASIAAALVCGLSSGLGCGLAYRPYYDPGGSGASIDEFTYWSDPHTPQTVELIDLRTGETLFAMDIPPRQQLVMKFVKNHGEETAWMPDLLKWELMPRGTKRGQLDNSMPVPPSFSRRLDVSVRDTPEMPDAPRYPQAAQASQPRGVQTDGAANQAVPYETAPVRPEPMREAPHQLEPAPQTPAQSTPAEPSADQPVSDQPTSDEPLIDLPDDPAPQRPAPTPGTSGQGTPGQMTPVAPR